MPEAAARRLLRRLLGVRTPGEVPPAPEPGHTVAATGAAAVAAVEAAAADAVVVAAGWPADARALLAAAARTGENASGRRLEILAAGGGAIATASGLALAGRRTAVFLTAADFAAERAALAEAAARRLPLVVHIAGRTGDAPAGVAVLVAADAQEAVDLAVAARRYVEAALLPAIVAMDLAETARSLQDVALPEPGLLAELLGDPDALVHPPTAAQATVFGRHRRRLPRRHDLASPSAIGTPAELDDAPVFVASRRVYGESDAPALLAEALAEVGRRTGRPLAAFERSGAEKAEIVVVATGVARRAAEAACQVLRQEKSSRVGAVGLRAVRPLATAAIVEALAKAEVVAVLEQVESPLGGEPPRTAQLRAALAGSEQAPRLVPVICRPGGTAPTASEVAALCRELARRKAEAPHSHRRFPAADSSAPRSSSPLFLGIDFAPEAAGDPKREALYDGLRRDFPQLSEIGIVADRPVDSRPDGSVTIAVIRPGAGESSGKGLAEALGAVLHAVGGGRLRGLPETATGQETAVDRLAWAEGDAAAPFALDPRLPIQFAVWTVPAPLPATAAEAVLAGLAAGADLLLPSPPGGSPQVPSTLWRAAGDGRVRLWAVPAGPASTHPDRARLLGAVVAVLRDAGRLAATPRRLLEAFREHSSDDPGEAVGSLTEFEAGLERTHRLAATEFTESGAEEPDCPTAAPAALARTVAAGLASASDLAGLWDRTASPRTGASGPLSDRQLVPDPFLALGGLPAVSAALRPTADARPLLPVIDPIACTGCGSCWTSCPEGAIVPALTSGGALVEAAMQRAREAGDAPVDALRRIAGQLASRLVDDTVSAGGGAAGPTLARAAATVLARAPLPEDARAAAGRAAAAAADALGDLPLAATAPFWTSPEAATRGSGLLLALAVDPDACNGCGLCLAECAPGALAAGPGGAAACAAARDRLPTLDRIPAPPPAAIENARRHPEVGPLAAALLGLGARTPLATATGGEPGSGAALAARQILAVAAAIRTAAERRFAEHIATLADDLAKAIHAALERALPDSDLDALAHGLDALARPEADLGELAGRIEYAFASGRVDVARLRRLVAAARSVADLRVRHQGALFGLVLARGAAPELAGSFPFNPAAVPLTVDAGGDVAGLTRGVVTGQLAGFLDDLATLRRARAELAGESPAFTPLRWVDLDAEERAACAPVVALAAEGAMSGAEVAGLVGLATGDLPVKVLLLAEADLGLDAGVDSSLAALALPRAVVASTSPAAPDHLERSVRAAFEIPGPAVVRIHAPSPMRHGFAPDRTLERARSAVAAGAWTLWMRTTEDGAGLRREEPGREVVPSREDPAAWALGERRFAHHFTALAGSAPTPTPLAAYLDLPSTGRAGKTPRIEGPTGPLRVSPDMVRACDDLRSARSWLDRLAAPSADAKEEPETVRPALDLADLEARHRSELASLAAGYEARLAAQRREVEAESARRVHRRLLSLLSPGGAPALHLPEGRT